MLQNIRDNLQGTVAKVIIGLIAIPFALFGINSFFTGSAPDAARVNGLTITEPELAQAIELQRRRLLGQLQENPDPALLDEARLRGPVLDSLIDRKLVQQVASDAGFSVSDAMLDQMILENANFQDEGKFSQARFQGLLASNGMSPSHYKGLLREDQLLTQVMSGLSASEFVTDRELGEVARITGQSLDVRYFTLPVSAMAGEIEVPDQQIQSYYDENRKDFLSEETVAVDYLELKLEDLFAPVPEKDLRQEYERRMKNFKSVTERHAAHIMLSSLPDDQARDKLAALRDRIRAGEDFATLAKQNSEDIGSASSGGDLGFSAGDAFPASFESALASLEPGEVSEPLKTDSGWHLVKLLEIRTQEAPGFDDLRATIERDLQRAAAEPVFVERSEKLADLTFNSDGLEDAARELGIGMASSAAFGRRGGEGIFADARVIAAAFGKDVLEDAQNSKLIELDAEHSLVLHLRQHQAARQQELSEVRERIIGLLRDSVMRKQVEQKAQTMLEALKGGQDVEQFAKNNGLEWQLVPKHRRGSPGLAPEISDAAFATARSDAGIGYGSVQLPNGDAVVFTTGNFAEGDYRSIASEQQAVLRNMLQQARGREVMAQYQKRLRDDASIERF